jgi:hypothetical protein
MTKPVDIAALRARLAEYDPDRERCDGFEEQRTNDAPDYVREGHPEYHDYDLVLKNPCCRPKGHEGPCRNSRAILGWPGREVLGAMIEEIEHLRSILPPATERGQGVGEGSWAVFAEKVTAERDELREEVERLRAQIVELRAALQDYLDNDDTNEGGKWEVSNAPWLAIKRRAAALLSEPTP